MAEDTVTAAANNNVNEVKKELDGLPDGSINNNNTISSNNNTTSDNKKSLPNEKDNSSETVINSSEPKVTSARSEDYFKLIAYGLSEKVSGQLDEIYKTGIN